MMARVTARTAVSSDTAVLIIVIILAQVLTGRGSGQWDWNAVAFRPERLVLALTSAGFRLPG